MKITMNELKKNLEEYLKSDCGNGMLLLIGKDDVEMMLDVFKALDKAIELLDSNMLCEKCPFPHDTERCTIEGCKDYLKECILKEYE